MDLNKIIIAEYILVTLNDGGRAIKGDRYTFKGDHSLEELNNWNPRDEFDVVLLRGEFSLPQGMTLAGNLGHWATRCVALFVPERGGYLVLYGSSSGNHRLPIGSVIPEELVTVSPA